MSLRPAVSCVIPVPSAFITQIFPCENAIFSPSGDQQGVHPITGSVDLSHGECERILAGINKVIESLYRRDA